MVLRQEVFVPKTDDIGKQKMQVSLVSNSGMIQRMVVEKWTVT